MITTPFTDDAFNKYINENERGSTILIGNWYEEQCIRDATGEGRTVAQRHIKRSGLLQDFTKLPSQTRVMDNTFDRVLGRKQTRKESEEVEGTETLHLPTTGLRFERDRAKVIEYANSQMEKLEDASKLEAQEREFGTTNDIRDTAFPISELLPSSFQKNATSKELSCGPPVPKEEMYANSGLDIHCEHSYTEEVPVTFYTQVAGSQDPTVRSTLSISPPAGTAAFGKSSVFTCPLEVFPGHHQYEEANRVLEATQFSKRHPKGYGINAGGTLADLKASLIDGLRNRGIMGLADLRADCNRRASNGCMKKQDVSAILKEVAGPRDDTLLDLYLTQLCTMKKNEIQVRHLFQSLQGLSAPNPVRARIHEAFCANWRPEMEAPSELNAFMEFMCDLYAMDASRVEEMLP